MRKVVNKYQVLPFYSAEMSDAQTCPVHCPATSLPPFQLSFDSVTDFSFELVSKDRSTTYAYIDALIEQSESDDGTIYLTYKGDTLPAAITEGLYQVKLTVDGAIYWSHLICASNKFRSLNIDIDFTCDTDLDPPIMQPPNAFYFTFSFTTPAFGIRYIEANIEGAGYTRLTDGKFDWRDFATLSGEETVYIRAIAIIGEVEIWKEYRFVFDENDACNTATLEEINAGGTNLERFAYLEFWNSSDMQDRNLLYQTGFKQRIYFEAHFDFPLPTIERDFAQNGNNENILRSSSTSERQPVDFYPVPDSIVLALASIGDHDNFQLVFTSDGTTQALSAVEFERRAEQNDDCSTGRLIVEYDRSFVACEENKTLV